MIMRLMIRSGLAKVLLTMFIALQLAACVDDDDSTTGALSESSDTALVASDVVVSGSVGDGPVIGATIIVYSNTGTEIGTMTSDNSASFQQIFKVKGKDYPLILEVNGGFDLVTGSEPDFQMLSVMMNPSEKQVNINPFSTLIVKIAQSLPGGINQNNVSLASSFVTEKLGFGLDLNLVPDPINSIITESNVANLVKASEVCGEMVRRTRDRISETGTSLSGDDVVDAIAADMTDGFLDGVGAAGTVSRISAVANVVSAQVLVEALSNNLKVGGVIATGVIDKAIEITNSTISSSQLTGSVRVTQGMLNRTRVSLAAARVLDSSFEVVDLANTVSGLVVGSLPDEVATKLPADSSRSLDNATLLSSTASDTDLALVNEVVVQAESGIIDPVTTDSGTTDPVTTDPVTTDSGTSDPVTTDPVTTDSGTTDPVTTDPVTTDSGTTDPVTTDPVTTDSGTTDPVTTDPVGGFTLNWTAPSTRADGTPLSLADIDGYHIYFGNSSGNYPDVIDVADGTAQSASVTDVPAGTYYLVMTTYDNTGLESAYSEEISKMAQ
jgi:hypothetical protein